MNTKELENVLERYLKLQTFPIGFKLVKEEKEIPEKARKFKNLTICQIYNLSRRYGWITYFDKNTSCPLGIIAYNFCEPDELWKSGKLAKDAGYAENEAVGLEFEKVLPRLNERYLGCLVAPISRIDNPDFIVVYGSPAQILRLVHASLFKRGGCLETCILGRVACAEYLEAFIKNKPKFVLPCYGDRLFGLTQDWEVAFSFPFNMAEEIARGLEETHSKGIRYPVPYTALRVELPMIESYREAVERMRK
ncbi:MAG: DUF169 domain-containing protein [Archaeoglobaceae archaeon]|nr:DUF169 domain-containing protein [Archaeoglobaceae archaeon]MDW8013027.1 DUF169 domain-containing protein [Archaeoglobaceae archaeon]